MAPTIYFGRLIVTLCGAKLVESQCYLTALIPQVWGLIGEHR